MSASWDDDEENAYRTSDDLVGRSLRRGTEKGLKAVAGALVGGALGGPVGAAVGAALGNLALDATLELPEAINRSQSGSDDE